MGGPNDNHGWFAPAPAPQAPAPQAPAPAPAPHQALPNVSGTATAKGAVNDPAFDAVKTATTVAGTVTGGLGMLNTASQLGGSSLLGAVNAADKTPLGHVLGKLNPLISLQQLSNGGTEAGHDIDQEGFAKAYHDPKFYEHLGGAQTGLSHLILPELGAPGKLLDLGLSGVEAGLNGLGSLAGNTMGEKARFSSDSLAGDALRHSFGDQSPGEMERQLVRQVGGDNPVANTVGTIADIGMNVLAAPVTGITSAGAAVADQVMKMFDW